MTERQILDFINNQINNRGELVYLIKGGSFLYGTNNENSDTDLFGIFIKKNNEIKDSIFVSTGDNIKKNTKDDVDIFLYSTDYILNNNFSTKVIDLLFSDNKCDSVIFRDNRVNNLFNKKFDILNKMDLRLHTSIYIMSQFKNYVVPGTNSFTFQFVYNYIYSNKFLPNVRLNTFVNDLLDEWNTFISKNSFPYDRKGNKVVDKIKVVKDENGNKFLILNNIFKIAFKDRIKMIGGRLEKKLNSFENQLLNFKDLSHVVRFLFMVKKVKNNENIVFPLENKNEILKVKYNKNKNFNLNEFYNTNLNKFNQIF